MTEEKEKPPVQRIKRKSRGRPRNKVLSHKERAALNKKKRASTLKTAPFKPKKTGKRGRPAFVLPFHEAKAIVQAEHLGSRNDFIRWWNLNIPGRIPKNPQRTYANDWKGWGDFLDVYNEYPDSRKNYRSFHDARDYARSLMLKTRTQWMEHAKAGKLPDDIPKYPNLAYGRTIYTETPKRGGHWISWKDWIGVSFVDKMQAVNSKIEVLVVTQMAHFPSNVYAFMMYKDLPLDIHRKLREEKVNVLKAYQISDHFDWGLFLSVNFNKYYEMNGVYLIPNINNVYYKFDMEMSKFDC